MQETQERVASILNELIETCKDGQHGFKTASEGITNSDLKNLFMAYSAERGQFINELQAEVIKLGEDPDKTGHIMGALHRAWIDIKSAVTSKDEHAILGECERGEDFAVEAYEKALQEELPLSVRDVVQRQYNKIRMVHDKVRALRDVTS